MAPKRSELELWGDRGGMSRDVLIAVVLLACLVPHCRGGLDASSARTPLLRLRGGGTAQTEAGAQAASWQADALREIDALDESLKLQEEETTEVRQEYVEGT